MKKLLYVTDLYYEAKGRNYYEEDLYLTSILKNNFDLVICHPLNLEVFEDDVDLIMFRNAGPVINFETEYKEFRERVDTKNLNTYNSFDGKADMNGKEYLIQLTNLEFPVTPTIDSAESIDRLPDVDKYVVKPKNGADSIGMEFIKKQEINNKIDTINKNILIQPFIEIEYEVSFCFIDKEFQYAIYTPNQDRRWELKEYTPTQEDLEFAEMFIEWNNISQGIQRVDACRDINGNLLLVELEDLNPFLSLLELSEEKQEKFVGNLELSIEKAMIK
ncbi:hypothetical protein PYL56_08050 [Staphylococcus succinus]|uniref:hypothetical protein n=1 Tax=Staphylococcus succinus TaxID=61015 RepID=UPI00248019E5|nr:hypothetical protein [Staphylococcus succinus]MDH9161319.1 hypothetical protein [Staphylococcus succinus]